MTALPETLSNLTFALQGTPSRCKLLDLLEERGSAATEGEPARILVAQASDYLEANDRDSTDRTLRAGTAILLLEASADHKQQLVSHIGFGAPGNSAALLISGRPAVGDRLTYELFDLGADDEVFETKILGADAESVFEESSGTTTAEVRSIDGESREAAFLNQISESLATTAAESTEPQPEQQKWIFNRTLEWSCPPGGASHGIAPAPQSSYITFTVTVYVYLDEQASGSFQWLYLETQGYQSVGASGMNRNDDSQRGWANGAVDVVVATPAGFAVNQTSPNNVNGSTTYTSSVSFNVGVDAGNSGGSGSAGVDVSHSQSETITDWAIQQNDLNNWSFYQNSPFNGTVMDYDDDMFTGGVNKDVEPLPSLSVGVMNFATMSVWNNQAVSSATVTLNLQLSAIWNYMGTSNDGVGGHTIFWGYAHPPTSFPFTIDLSLVT